MKLSLHGVSLWYSNAVTQLRLAHEAGFQGLELLPEHLFRYLENGGTFEAFRNLMAKYQVEITCINALKRIGRHKPEEQAALMEEAQRICRAAAELNCPVVQIMALTELDHLPEAERNAILRENIRMIADIGKPLGIKFQIEVVAFTTFNSLQQGLDMIAACERDNLGLVVDFGTCTLEVKLVQKKWLKWMSASFMVFIFVMAALLVREKHGTNGYSVTTRPVKERLIFRPRWKRFKNRLYRWLVP